MKLDNRQSLWRKKIDRWVGIPLLLAVGFVRRFFFFYFRRPSKKNAAPPRILVIKLSALGDAVLLLPALYRLRQVFKKGEAQIDFLAGNSNASFLKLIPAIDTVSLFSIGTCFRLLFESYDLVIDFDQWARAPALLSGLLRARQVSGFRSPNQFRHFAYDLQLNFNLRFHMAQNFWNLATESLRHVGRDVQATFAEDKEAVRRDWAPLLRGTPADETLPYTNAKFSVVHPGCGEHGMFREWPVENWRTVIESLKQTRGGQVVVTGKGPHEKELADQLVSAGALSAVDGLSLVGLIQVLSQAEAVFASNTGIMHLADFINDSVTVLEGPTNPLLWGPLWRGKDKVSQLACAPCLTWGYDYGCSDPVCLKNLTPSKVLGG